MTTSESNLHNVLIFAHECAPYNRAESTVGAQRPAQLAKYLPEFGWRAIVVCRDVDRQQTTGPDYARELRHEIGKRLAESDPARSVVIPTPSLPFDGILDRTWRSVARRGAGPIARATRKVLTLAKLATGDYSQNWQPCARVAADAVDQSIPIDICVGEHSPDAGLFLARWFASRAGVPWVADFRDPILQPLAPLVQWIYKPIARGLLATASSTVNVNVHWAELDAKLFGIPSVSIPNGYDPSEFGEPATLRESLAVTTAYFGNIIRGQDLSLFLKGLALARNALGEQSRALRFLYRGLMHEQVRRMVREAGVDDICEVGSFVPRADVLREQQSVDFLLLLSIAGTAGDDPYFAKGFYPAKTFEYFGAGRPIICVPGDRGLLDTLIDETNTGRVLRSPVEVCEFLVSAVRDRNGGRPHTYLPNRNVVERYTRRALARQFADVLDQASGRVRRSPDGVRGVGTLTHAS